MEEQLLRTIAILKKINSHFKQGLSEFDEDDVIDTLQGSKKRLKLLLEELETVDLNDKEKLNSLLVHLKLEYDNFLWCFDEMVEAVGKTLIQVPD